MSRSVINTLKVDLLLQENQTNLLKIVNEAGMSSLYTNFAKWKNNTGHLGEGQAKTIGEVVSRALGVPVSEFIGKDAA